MNTLSWSFKADLLWCEKCKLSQTRTNVVIGDGPEDAKIVLIGEAPGRDEDIEGIPFCGRSGKLLRKALKQAGLLPYVFITNIVKCRPPNNRDPEQDEIEACFPYLKAQIQAMEPKLIVGVGRIASGTIVPGFKVSRDHGKIFTLSKGTKFIGIYHPAAALRNPKVKKLFEEDIQAIKKLP